MKKTTLKISAFLLFALFALQAYAQPACPDIWTENGTYKISTCGLTPELYMTINVNAAQGNPFVEWQPEITGNDETQLFNITDHRTPASNGLMEITANITGVGAVTLCTAEASGHPNLTLTVRAGDPASVTPLDFDYSGLDQFQRRKTNGGVQGGNDALFLRNPNGDNSRYGVIPTAAGDPIEFNGGGIDSLRFVLIAPLGNEEFDASSVFISNPVKNELTIDGLNQTIKQISVYDLLGKQLITSKPEGNITSTKIDLSGLNTGLYIVKLDGENGASFSKKIIKE